MQSGILSVDAHSVTVIELDAEVDVTPMYGCTDQTATNFDTSATEDDGSCEYPPEPILGCTDNTATNFDAEATEDDGLSTTDSCSDVFCDACPEGWTTIPAAEGECCPSCQEPNSTNQTNTTTQTNGTTNQPTNESTSNNETQLPDPSKKLIGMHLTCRPVIFAVVKPTNTLLINHVRLQPAFHVKIRKHRIPNRL